MDVVFNNLTFFSVKGIMFMVFCILGIMVVGYALGRIDIKGVSLGTAGVFIVALLFGALLGNRFLVHEVGASMNNVLKSIENIGLIFFVTAVGLIAGPNFFKDLRKNYKSYVSLGLLIIIIGGVSCKSLLGVHSVRVPLGVSQENNVLVGEHLEYLLYAGESAETGVENSDGFIFHSLLLQVPGRLFRR